MRWIATSRSLRRARFAACVASVVFMLAIATTTTREIGANLGYNTHVVLGNACMQVIRVDPNSASLRASKLGVYVLTNWQMDWAFAWRPFHATQTHWPTGAPTKSHLLVIPLWPFAIGAIAFAAYTHGRLATLRALRQTTCRACGYELAQVQIAQSIKICPECGLTVRRSPLAE